MKKLFEIPIYALNPSTLDARANKRIHDLKTQFARLDTDVASQAIETQTFPMRSWDYNHIVGYIRIMVSKTDILFDIFMPVPIPKRYVWNTTRKKYFQNIGANGTHIYHGSLKTNEDISTAISNMLDLVIVAHIPSRFHVDRSAFDTLNKQLDYLNIIQSI